MTLHASSQAQLRQFIEQIERLDEERKAIAADIADKFAEAKALGFDPKIMKKVLALRKKDPTERTEEEALLDTYMAALGMAGTPMGDYIDRQDEGRARTIARQHGIPQSVVDDLVEAAP